MVAWVWLVPATVFAPPPPASLTVCDPLSLLSEAGWRVKEMGPGWREIDAEDGIIYLTPETVAPARVTVREGKLYDAQGKLLKRKGSYAYVMDTAGTLYVATGKMRNRKYRHSSFLAGGPVISAGEITVKDGVILKVTNSSGHYSPRRVHLMQLQAVLAKQGYELPLDRMQIYYRDHPLRNPDFGGFTSADRFLPELQKLEYEDWPEAISYCLKSSDAKLKSRALLFMMGSSALNMIEVDEAVELFREVARDPDPAIRAELALAIRVWAKQTNAEAFATLPTP